MAKRFLSLGGRHGGAERTSPAAGSTRPTPHSGRRPTAARLAGIAGLVGLLSLTAGAAEAQTAAEMREKVNRGTVGIVSGSVTGTYIRIASDLAAELNNRDLRVLVTAGLGSVQNIDDLLYLRGIDAAIVQSDVLEYIKREEIHPNVAQRINYISKLYNEEFHLLASTSVSSIEELRGQPVVLGNTGSGSHMTASIVFETLGIDVQPVPAKDHGTALQMLKDGEVKAWVRVTGKPNASLGRLAPEDNIHLLSVPQTPELLQTYLPSQLNHDDYPGLVPEGQTTNTIAVGAVLAVYAWEPSHPRHTKVARFVNAFFDEFVKEEFYKPQRQKKWREVNLGAELPGWTRFAPAANWLALSTSAASADSEADLTPDQMRLLKALQTNDLSGLSQDEREFVETFRSLTRAKAAQSQ